MKKIFKIIAVIALASCQTKVNYNATVDSVQLVTNTSAFNAYKMQVDSVVYIVTTNGSGAAIIRHGVISDSITVKNVK